MWLFVVKEKVRKNTKFEVTVESLCVVKEGQYVLYWGNMEFNTIMYLESCFRPCVSMLCIWSILIIIFSLYTTVLYFLYVFDLFLIIDTRVVSIGKNPTTFDNTIKSMLPSYTSINFRQKQKKGNTLLVERSSYWNKDILYLLSVFYCFFILGWVLTVLCILYILIVLGILRMIFVVTLDIFILISLNIKLK